MATIQKSEKSKQWKSINAKAFRAYKKLHPRCSDIDAAVYANRVACATLGGRPLTA